MIRAIIFGGWLLTAGAVYMTVTDGRGWAVLVVLLLPIVALATYDYFQTAHTIWRIYPIVGRGRWIAEGLRPKLLQYFIETDTSGTPINRITRSVVYQRSKEVRDTVPFGTQYDLYREGTEWLNHSMYPYRGEIKDDDMRITIGGPDCRQPYNASIINSSAMSYGSLSGNAVESISHGAKMAGFAQNTGEGAISHYHLKGGNDLIWQIGTGYFGARNEDGTFSEELFEENATRDVVKMLEIKLSQGAKPGHGGILPASKNTPEIAGIRRVQPGTKVVSPPYHSAFDSPETMLKFIRRLRDLSGGKPVGIKFCLSDKREIEDLFEVMKRENTYPDYIAIDGAEGGTGAAPPEFSNSMGTPLYDALIYTDEKLKTLDIRDKIKLIASGKIITGFDVFKALALGADVVYMARAMMLSLGCIQALECNTGNCPTGITTHDPHKMRGLVVNDKKYRVAQFHKHTIDTVKELLIAAGIDHPDKLNKSHVMKRVSDGTVLSYQQLYDKVGDTI